MTKKASFRERARANRITPPSRIADFSEDLWTAEFRKYSDGSAEDERLHRAGLWFARKFRRVRHHATDIRFGRRSLPALVRDHCGFVNRGTHLAASMELVQSGQTDTMDVAQLLQAKFSSETTPLPTHPVDLMEGIVDSLKYALDSLIDRGRENDAIGETKVLGAIVVHLNLAMMFHLLLGLWGDCLWNGWFIEPGADEDVVRSAADPLDIAKAVSRYRVDALQVQTTHLVAHHAERRVRGAMSGTHVSRVLAIEGAGKGRRFRYGRVPANDDVRLHVLMATIIAEELYFAEFLDLALPRYPGVRLRDVLDAWGALACATKALVARFPQESDVRSVGKLAQYAPTLTRTEMCDVISQSTGCEMSKARTLSEFFVRPLRSREDFWERPILAMESGTHHPIVYALRFPNLMRVIERWARDGGLDLEVRGPLFERHARRVLAEAIAASPIRQATAILERPAQIRFTSARENEPEVEEIDIVLRIGRTILLGEAKCMLTPSSPYAEFTYYQTVERAARQIARKAKRCEDDKASALAALHAIIDPGSDVMFTAFILVNTPLLAGSPIRGIPVIDLTILQRYFDPGYVDHFVIMGADGREIVGEREHFYRDEETAETRIGQYLLEPPQLKHYKANVTEENRACPSVDEEDRSIRMVRYEVRLPTSGARFEIREGKAKAGMRPGDRTM